MNMIACWNFEVRSLGGAPIAVTAVLLRYLTVLALGRGEANRPMVADEGMAFVPTVELGERQRWSEFFGLS